MDESGGGQDCDPGQDFERRDGGKFTMGRTTRGKKGGKTMEMKRMKHQFLIFCSSYFLLYLLWLPVN